MGCAQSRIDNEEAVSRCKERRNFMKEAVVARNAFAAGHSGYAMSLKDTGAALSDFAQGEVEQIPQGAEAGDAYQPQLQTPGSELRTNMVMPPPPPPLPNFSPSPLKRSATMPEILNKGSAKGKGVSAIAENDDEIEEDGEELKMRSRRNYKRGMKDVVNGGPQTQQSNVTPVAPPDPDSKDRGWDYFFNDDGNVESMKGDTDEEVNEKVVTENKVGHEQYKDEFEMQTPEKTVEKVEDEIKSVDAVSVQSTTSLMETQRGVKMVPSNNLLKLLEAIDDHFLKASESAQEVSKMLEANRMHYHSNFANNKGNENILQINHS